VRPDAITTIFIRRILSVAETGKPEWDPGAVYIYSDDNRFSPPRRQVTVSIGFTESGNLRKMLESYASKGGEKSDKFINYLPNMGRKDKSTLAGDRDFIGLLKEAGKDPKMREAQEESFDTLYLGPAFDWADKNGFEKPLSYLVIADSYLHSGSMLPFLMNSFPDKKPVDGGDEQKWIKAYLDARRKWLANHSNKILNGTVYRADSFLREIAKGDWDLDVSSVVMHGTEVTRGIA
jgi:chitosanase